MSNTAEIRLSVLKGSFAIHRFPPGSGIPRLASGFSCLTRTDEETSLVCSDEAIIPSMKSSRGWKCLKVEGPLDLDQVGILHALTRPLHEAGISVFAISTYDTDYLLVPGRAFRQALVLLSKSCRIEE